MTYNIAVCTVKNSWWWTEELSETSILEFYSKNKFDKWVHLVSFIIRSRLHYIFSFRVTLSLKDFASLLRQYCQKSLLKSSFTSNFGSTRISFPFRLLYVRIQCWQFVVINHYITFVLYLPFRFPANVYETWQRPRRTSGRQSPAFFRGGPDWIPSRSMWGVCWIKWHRNRIFSEVLLGFLAVLSHQYSLLSYSPPALRK